MLTIITHNDQEGVSARTLHAELSPRSGFTAWFSHYKEILRAEQDFYLLAPFVKGNHGRNKHKVGDYLLPLAVAQDITKRSMSQLSPTVQAKLLALAQPDTPAPGEIRLTVEPTTKPSLNDLILDAARKIHALGLEEQDLVQQKQALHTKLEEVQLQLLELKFNLRDKLDSY